MTNKSSLRWLQRLSVVLLAALPAVLVPLLAMSTEPAAASPSLPRDYRLDAVVLRVLRQPAQGQPKQELVLTGTGSATLELGHAAGTQSFTLPAPDVVGLLNGLYRLRFFDLPATLGARSSVFLLPDGKVGTQLLRLPDTTSMAVCFTLPGYEKCVRYAEGDGPQELEAWARAALADAQRRTRPAAPSK